MFPIPTVLIGCSEQVLPHLRRELIIRESNLEGEYPDVRCAIAGLYPTKETNRLLIFHVKSAADVTDLKRLSATFVSVPVLALLDAGKDANAIFAAMRAGAIQVVPAPLEPADFRAAMDCIGLHYGHSPTASRVLALSGVNGGCGTTSVAINLAYELAHCHRLQTILVEMSLQMGMLATYLNIEPRFTIQDLLKDVDNVDGHMVQKALTKYAENFHVLPGPHKAISMVQVSAEDVRRLLDFARRLADVVVLDVPATFTDVYFDILTQADQVVLLGEQKIPSIRNLKLVLETLDSSATHHPHIVINRYDPKMKGFTLAELETLLAVGNIMHISDDRAAMDAALTHGHPLRLENAGARILADIDVLARSVLALEGQPLMKTSGNSIFGHLMQAFRLS